MRVALTVLGVALLALAAAVWRISDAHGHGMARMDRRMMVAAIVLGVAALVAAAVRSVAHRRANGGGPRSVPPSEPRARP